MLTTPSGEQTIPLCKGGEHYVELTSGDIWTYYQRAVERAQNEWGVPDPAWHLEGSTAPEAAVGLDLLEDPDPRSKKAGEKLLRRLDEAGRVRAGSGL